MKKSFFKDGNEDKKEFNLKRDKETFFLSQYEEVEDYLTKDYDFKKQDTDDDNRLLYILKNENIDIQIDIPNYLNKQFSTDPWGNIIMEPNKINHCINIVINNKKQEIKLSAIKNSNYTSDYKPEYKLDESKNIFNAKAIFRNFDIIVDALDKKFDKDKYESLIELVDEIFDKIE